MLTVFIATRNGERTLPAVLEAFTCVTPPLGNWKLVVIDNGSTDRTRELVLSFRDRLPVVLLSEPRLGKNEALNTGLAELEGDLAVFTDDDVVPRPDWLVELRMAADANPGHSLFGGLVLPRWETEPPKWIGWVPPGPNFALSDPAWLAGPAEPGLIYGPNMAVRADVFYAGTRFDPGIGPQGSNYRMGSETELLLRLHRQGHKAWFVRSAVVEHCIRSFQMEQPWLMKRAKRFGRGQYYLLYEATLFSILGFPTRLVLRIFRRWARIAKARMISREQELVMARWELNYLIGQVIESRELYCAKQKQRSGSWQPQVRS